MALFDGFDYVALGHLHRAQAAFSDRVRYAGSLLKYSFNEADHRKSVTVVEVARDGLVASEEVELPVAHDLRRVRGSFAELLAGPVDPGLARAYVEVVLTDPEPVLNPVDRLRQIYPHILSLRREDLGSSLLGPGPSSGGIKTRDVADLFGEFFADVRGSALSEPQTKELAAAVTELERVGREAVEG